MCSRDVWIIDDHKLLLQDYTFERAKPWEPILVVGYLAIHTCTLEAAIMLALGTLST